MILQYPNDRHDGYTILSLNSMPYVARFVRADNERNEFQNLKKYFIARRILMKKYYGKFYEPCALKNLKREIL